MLWNDMVNRYLCESKWLLTIEALLSIYTPEGKMLCNCKFVLFHCLIAIEKMAHRTCVELCSVGKDSYRISHGLILILKSRLYIKIWVNSVKGGVINFIPGNESYQYSLYEVSR